MNSDRLYKYPFLLLGLYITFLILTQAMATRLVMLGPLLEPGGIFFFPLSFPILDIVGEVYGYSYPRLFIWIGLVCELVFAVGAIVVSHLPFPSGFTQADAFRIVFDPTFRYVLSTVIATLVGEFINIYLLATWKIRLNGKRFISRCILSTALGQLALSVIADSLIFFGKVSSSQLFLLIINGYSLKLLYAFILAFPSWLIVRYLQEEDQVNHFDISTNFNPFTLREAST